MMSRRGPRKEVVVWQYNCGKDRSAMLDLQIHLEGGGVDLVLMQEPYC